MKISLLVYKTVILHYDIQNKTENALCFNYRLASTMSPRLTNTVDKSLRQVKRRLKN